MRRVRAQQHFPQRVPEIRAFRDVDGQRGQRVGDAVFRGLRQSVSVRRHHREDAKDGRGVAELRAAEDVDAALVEDEIGARDGSAAAAELAVEADRGGKVFHQQRGAAVDHARMPVIGAHPVGRVGRAARLQPDGLGRRFVLRLPVQRVVVAAVAEVQETSCRGEKIEGRFRIAARALEHAAPLPRPLLGLLQMEQEREPHSEMVVAQAAGTVLQVGLEVKDGVGVLLVAGAGDLAQLLRDRVPLA